MGYFIQELKRRNVVRVGFAYLVVSWLVIQIIETVSEPLSLPGWTIAFFIVLFLAGFPVACLFAWAFELTPEGVKKTEEVDKDVSVTANTGRKLDYAIIATLVLALAYFIWERQQPVDAIDVVEEVAGTVLHRFGVLDDVTDVIRIRYTSPAKPTVRFIPLLARTPQVFLGPTEELHADPLHGISHRELHVAVLLAEVVSYRVFS